MYRCLNCNRVFTRYSDICDYCGEVDWWSRDEPAARFASSSAVHPAELPLLPATPRRNGDRSDDRHMLNGEIMATRATAPELSGERLSRLQKRILLLAGINRIQAGIERRSPSVDLYFAEALREVYGLEPAAADGERIPPIDQRRYSSGMAAVSRAARRLELRGLVAYQRGGYNRLPGVSIVPAGQQLIREWVNERKRLSMNADQSEMVIR